MSEQDVARIAAGLSPAQKRVIKEMSSRLSWGEGWFDLYKGHPELVRAEQTRAQCISYGLTPLGLAVRHFLQCDSEVRSEG